MSTAKTAQANQSAECAANTPTVPQKAVEANVQFGTEVAKFLSRRLRAQADLLENLCACRDFQQFADTQRTFWDGATKDYAEEAQQLGELARRNLASFANLAPLLPNAKSDRAQ